MPLQTEIFRPSKKFANNSRLRSYKSIAMIEFASPNRMPLPGRHDWPPVDLRRLFADSLDSSCPRLRALYSAPVHRQKALKTSGPRRHHGLVGTATKSVVAKIIHPPRPLP